MVDSGFIQGCRGSRGRYAPRPPETTRARNRGRLHGERTGYGTAGAAPPGRPPRFPYRVHPCTTDCTPPATGPPSRPVPPTKGVLARPLVRNPSDSGMPPYPDSCSKLARATPGLLAGLPPGGHVWVSVSARLLFVPCPRPGRRRILCPCAPLFRLPSPAPPPPRWRSPSRAAPPPSPPSTGTTRC